MLRCTLITCALHRKIGLESPVQDLFCLKTYVITRGVSNVVIAQKRAFLVCILYRGIMGSYVALSTPKIHYVFT